MITEFLRRVAGTPAAYPITCFYAISMVVVVSSMSGVIDLSAALIVLTLTAMSLLLIAEHTQTLNLRAQVMEMHDLANGRLVRRINQLAAALQDGKVKIPDIPNEGEPRD